MKVLSILALTLAFVALATAFDLRKSKDIKQREILVDVREDSIEGRITNGKRASEGQFPYQVGLSVSVSGGSAWCGGSLISSTFVLTAAHCVDGATGTRIYLGATARASPKLSHSVTKGAFTIHSGWNPVTLKNDVALIRIPSTAQTTYIKAVALPPISSSYSTYAGSVAIASGWGKTSDSSGVADYLMYADMPVITNTVCKNTYGTIVSDGNICASTNGGISTCNGDSGGPLVLKSNQQLIGVTSFGSSAGCTKGYPVAFSRVTHFRSWIYQYTTV